MKGDTGETLSHGNGIHRQADHKRRSTLFHRVSRFRFWVGVIILIPVFGVFVAFQAGYLSAYVIISGSMEPTLLVKDCVIVRSTDHAIPGRGEIVAFKDPFNPAEILVKRTIGVPGDKIQVIWRYLYINGKLESRNPLDMVDFLKSKGYIAEVGPHEIFVLGDNRYNSFDSLDFGMVKEEYIIGKIILIYWPPSRMRLIKNDYEI